MNELNTTDALPDEDSFENDKLVHIHAILDVDVVKKQFAELLKNLGVPADRIRLKRSKRGLSNICKNANHVSYYEDVPPDAARALAERAKAQRTDDELGKPQELYFTLKIPIWIEVEDFTFDRIVENDDEASDN